jgi:hypothetical protein
MSDEGSGAEQNIAGDDDTSNGDTPPNNDGTDNQDQLDDGPADVLSRIVLIETFTSTDCYWCDIEEEPALKQIAKDYNRGEVVIVAYHGFYGNDPYTTTEGDDRADDYGGIQGTPTVWFDGTYNKVGGNGNGVDAMYNDYNGYIKIRSAVQSKMSITLSGQITSSVAEITAQIDDIGDLDSKDLKLRFALVEDGLQYKGKIFDWVVRDLSEKSLADVTFPFQYQESFGIDSTWNSDNLAVVAWIQDDQSREVHQSAFFGFN